MPKGRVGALLVIIPFLAVACGRSSSKQAARNDATPIKVERAQSAKIRRAIDVVATLAAEDEVTISSETEGRVSRILADLGDRVKAGQALVELDPEKQQYNYDQQRAALARALAKFGAPDAAHLPPIEQTPDVQKADVELAHAKQMFDRTRELSQSGLIPRQTLDDADTSQRSAQAVYASALQNAKDLRADIDASVAAMKLADRQLRDASIRAPFDGYVQKRLVALGEFVKAQVPVMNVVRVDPLKVTAEIPERMAPWIIVGQPIELHVDAYPDKTITGKVSRISPAVNIQTRAFPFEALVANSDNLLKPGTFARVHIQSTKVDDVLTVSYAAIQYRYGVNRVFVVAGDHLVARELKVGERAGDRIEVVDGLKPDELVALTDVDRLIDGMKVSVDDAL